MTPLFKVYMHPSAKETVAETLFSGYITQGPKVEEFEQELEKHLGFPVATVNSCTSAITLALRLAGVRQGDEVITTPMTCQATNVPILAFGAIPIWADINPFTGLIDPDSVISKITSKTKAIMCVDWGGTPCDLDILMDIAQTHKVKLIEDAAHAFGSIYKGRNVGSIADYTCFSFQAIKHLTTGDGGALACLDPEDLKRAKLLRWYGIDREAKGVDFRGSQDVEEWGYKFHMNDINATIGLANLNTVVESIVPYYSSNGLFYNYALHHDFVRTQPQRYKYISSSWVATFLISLGRRDEFRKWANEQGIQVSQVHWRNDMLTAFAPYATDLPGVDRFSEDMICLPSHWQVSVAEVAEQLDTFWK